MNYAQPGQQTQPAYAAQVQSADRPMGAVEKQNTELESVLSGTLQRIGVLEQRLSPVLRQNPPTPGAQVTATPQPIMAPLAEAIRGHGLAAAALLARINDLIDRIDL